MFSTGYYHVVFPQNMYLQQESKPDEIIEPNMPEWDWGTDDSTEVRCDRWYGIIEESSRGVISPVHDVSCPGYQQISIANYRQWGQLWKSLQYDVLE